MDILNILIERIEEMVAGFVRLLPQLLIAALVLLVAWFVANLARRGVTQMTARTRLRPSLAQLLVTLSGVLVWLFAILVSLAVILPGVNAGSLLAVLGLGSVAIGLAFQEIFQNFFAGILIMLRKKMRISDYIECEGVEGRVELITLRETYLRKLDNQLTIVPNSYLFTNPVRIVTDATKRRHEITVGVAYDTDLDKAKAVLEEATGSAGHVDTSRPVEVFAAEFNDSSIDFTVRWWSGSKVLDMHKSRDEVVRSIKRALDGAGIEIPFPQRVHWFKEPLKLDQSEDGFDPEADEEQGQPRKRKASDRA